MAAKAIVDIAVNDDSFNSFLDKFNGYKKAVDELPEAWRMSSRGIGDSAKETEKMRHSMDAVTKAFTDGVASISALNGGLDQLNQSLDKAGKTQSDLNKKTSGASNFLSKASKDAKSLAGHLKDATTSLLSWGSIVGVFTGLAGAGGLWGMNRLAGSAAAQRFTAMGLGTTAGGLNSAAVNFQSALGNPVGTLGAIRDAQADLGKRWTFNAMGVDANQDPTKLLPQMIKSARDIFVKNGSTQQGAEAYGLTNYFTLDDLNRFKKMSDAEIDAMAKQAAVDTQKLQVSDRQLKQWQDFNIQLDRSKVSISNTFIRGLAPLTPELTKLSDAFSGAIDTVLKSPELGKWIDSLAGGIKKFGDYLASPSFKSDVDAFMSAVEKLGKVIMSVIGWITGDSSSASSLQANSSFLNNNVKTDASGTHYVKGGLSDPNTPAGSKWLARQLYALTGTAPTEYDQYFEEAAKKYGVDSKMLKAITGAESSWDQNAKSGAGALGLMQVMPKNFQPGENPFDPRDNIMAGARVYSDALKWESKNGGGLDEVLRYYNGGRRRGSKENINYPSRVREQYMALYGKNIPAMDPNQQTVAGQQNSAKTNQLLQQIADNTRDGARGVTINNNTGGNAVVTSTQLGGFG
ncbi:TPA: lytic transglycosylase domain-containing protein [Kluyvera ascorbata]|uniref:lytic transglycosylase domain-containing protein n=1 Tax=Kluyvera ascorbata TaxID=51288 RepID=UPI0029120849|nr:lytic transglycosylase domain-containing protein [Kluyvera ascorbata]MDU3912020.1 lytic transglycosylase domain-containing protein [Kluyvera ascorbata]HDG1722365.1 lytic transglycosylase domain-containing protein [Kluyvera ascorbata]